MRKFSSILALAVSAMFATSAAAQSTLTLTGIIRDFKAAGEPGGQPDFESSITGVVTGIVNSTLGADGTPVYAHDGMPFGGVTSSTTFDQWFHDTPGVNLTTTYPITLTETTPGSGIYTYANTSFFPIDNMLFGNYSNTGHNYAFTYMITGAFNYLAGKKQVFSFIGDDDVWTFLNNKLAVDLGGVHGASSASVDLDTFMAGSPSGMYPFNFFFAERHTSASDFTLTTSAVIVPEPSSIVLMTLGVLGASVIALRQQGLVRSSCC